MIYFITNFIFIHIDILLWNLFFQVIHRITNARKRISSREVLAHCVFIYNVHILIIKSQSISTPFFSFSFQRISREITQHKNHSTRIQQARDKAEQIVDHES